MKQVPTGIKGLDEILSGGFPFPSVVLVAGEPGSGKTTFGLQTLFNAAANGERGIYITGISEPIDQIQAMMSNFSFYDPETVKSGMVKFLDIGEVLFTDGPSTALDLVTNIVLKEDIKRIVIDPITTIAFAFNDPKLYRKFLHDFFVTLKSLEVLTILVAEFSPELITQPESFMVDGVIFMYLQNIENPLVFKPGIQIRKMRGVEHTRDILRLGFTKDGIRIL
ncbi:circadian clock protein kinase KaiC [archaeon BMS3Bbin16]|nr:circadian clock protein kinase KaiC [archaeon BMS3Bbin16]